MLRFGGPKTPFFQGFGPFSTKNQALKALEKHPAVDQAKGVAVVPMLNGNGYDLLLASVDAPVKTRGDWVTVRADAEAHARGEKPRP